MAGKKSVIETGVDKLVKLVAERKKISIKDAAKELGVSVSSIEDWADFLEEEDIVGVETKFATVYLVEKKIGKKEVIQKVKAVRDKKEALCRRIESSINALQRDGDEIKLIDSEFQRIKSLLQENFKSLSKRMDQLQDFRSAHRDIESRQREFEREYEDRLKRLDAQLKSEQAGYKSAIEEVEHELESIRKEKEELSQMRASEHQLEKSVAEVNHMLGTLRAEIETKNKQLDIDEQRLKKAEEHAAKVKDEIISGSKELDAFAEQMKKSHAEIDALEKAFLKDVENITSGRMENVGAIKESKELVAKMEQFFSKTREIEEMIRRTEKEEEELKAHFEKLARTVQAFTAVASAPQIKNEMDALKAELSEIERRKSLLSDKMGKLRQVVRAIVR
ncbi:hypothetical protein KY362_00440 [Candidatus Woesearchaeota archaeon]|nr:hypothetical protein [Candidatus Woesearchaeota archaeon]